jgi:prevent-host-death family protein
MIQISVRELHMKTGEWVRKVSDAEPIIVTDRHRPVAKLVPFTSEDEKKSFAARPLVEGFSTLPKLDHDSAQYISDDRDRS